MVSFATNARVMTPPGEERRIDVSCRAHLEFTLVVMIDESELSGDHDIDLGRFVLPTQLA